MEDEVKRIKEALLSQSLGRRYPKLSSGRLPPFERVWRVLESELSEEMEFKTLARGKEFSAVHGTGGVSVTPSETGIHRFIRKEEFEEVYDEICEYWDKGEHRKAFMPGKYQTITRNSSYIVTLIAYALEKLNEEGLKQDVKSKVKVESKDINAAKKQLLFRSYIDELNEKKRRGEITAEQWRRLSEEKRKELFNDER